MIDEIRKFIEKCPLFSGNSIKVNYLGDKTVTYSIESVPANPVIKNYADGGKFCQELFVIASRELYSKSDKNNTAVTKFYEDFSAWIEAQDKAKNYPQLPGSCTAQGIEVLTGQYLYDIGNMDARYQIQCRLKYYKEF